jgi:hypothetical protein
VHFVERVDKFEQLGILCVQINQRTFGNSVQQLFGGAANRALLENGEK